jgi:hypothetical protein
MKRRPVAVDLDQRLCIDDTHHCHHVLAALLFFSSNIRHFQRLGNTKFQAGILEIGGRGFFHVDKEVSPDDQLPMFSWY